MGTVSMHRRKEPTASELLESLNGARVLFAEDSHDTIALLKQSMALLHWNGIYVENAVEIMNAVNNLMSENLTLDAVVADISFISGPKLTGITAVREIRKVMPNVPVIFISAYVTSIIREEVRRVGAEIVQKPFDIESLFVRLSQLIYWNRTATSTSYKGTERRSNSVNRTTHCRRDTDYTLSTPPRIAETLDEVTKRDKT